LRITSFIQVLARLNALVLVAVLLLVLTACPRPLVPPTGLGQNLQLDAESGVTGRVEFGARATQATIKDDVAPGATVSLIEVATGNTVTTTRTNADGTFVLKYSNGFKPQNNGVYYFEAIKGLAGATGQPNAIGADAVRVRTIASYRRGGWVTLSSRGISTAISITPMTTALSIVVSLRSTTNRPLDVNTLFGAIRLGVASDGFNDTVDLADPTLVAMVQSTYTLVLDSFAKDRDPLRWIRLSGADASHNTVMLPDVPFTIAYLSPAEQVALGEIRIVGTNFASLAADNEVAFQTNNDATVSATVLEVSPDLSRLTVQVPATAVNGPVTLTIGQGDKRKTLTGPPFRLATRDGHSVVDAVGNVYAVNKSLGTVAIIEPIPGSDKTGVRALITGLTNPGALTFGPSGYTHLYVAVGGATPQVRKYDISVTPPTYTPYHGAGGVPNPSGIAFRVTTGALYLTDSLLNRLYVIPSQGAAVQEVILTGAALNNPRGLSFGPDGKLYVANSGANNVLAIDLGSDATGTATPYISGLSTPWGLSFDNKGSFYVSNNQGNSIYTVPVVSAPGETPLVYGSLTSFASIPTPGGIDSDSSGYLYVADRESNGVYRINTLAESRQIGFGLSYPVATWADAEGIFALTDEGRLLKIDPQEKLTVYAEGLTNARGLVRDSSGNFYINQRGLKALTQIRSDGSSIQVMQGLTAYTNSNLQIRNDKITFRKSSSDVSAQGQVDEYDLKNLTAMPIATYKAMMRKAIAVALDESGGVNNGKYFVLQDKDNSEQNILKVTRKDADNSDTVPFIPNPADRLKMVDPTDLAVASDGKIWVADRVGSDGNGSLHVFNTDGSYDTEITAIEDPVRLRRIGTQIVASAHEVAGYVRFYNADKTVAQTLTGLNQPVGVSFSGTSMYVNTHGDGNVYKIDAYATLGSVSLAPLPAPYYATGNVNDIEMLGTDLMFTSGSRIRQLLNDRVTLNTSWRSHYNDIMRLNLTAANQLIYASSQGWVHQHGDGNYRGFVSGLAASNGRGDYGTPLGAGVFTNTSFISYGRSGADSMLVETRLDGSLQQTRYYGSDWSAMVSNGTDTVYLARIIYGHIYKWTNGTLTTLVSTNDYSTSDHIYGLAYYNGKLYQPICEKHEIREVDANSGAKRVLTVGLVSPEL
jgi:sugar lactone lactonase YvrE